MQEKYEGLRLDNQLCFPLYAVSKEIIRKYRPFLDKLDLTYTQYLTMLVLWEHDKMNVKELGAELFLDSGTLSPVLKSLENKNYITRTRDKDDERILTICLTELGNKLKDKAVAIPKHVANSLGLVQKEALDLYKLLYKVLMNVNG